MSNRSEIEQVKDLALQRYRGNKHGIHGPAHWQRVWRNAQDILKYNDADPVVVELFSFLHDCCRTRDGHEPDHGLNAAQFIRGNQNQFEFLSNQQFDLLIAACEGHTNKTFTEDVTIGTCWDADRLDLGRVGKYPKPEFLSTEAAEDYQLIHNAYERSLGGEQ